MLLRPLPVLGRMSSLLPVDLKHVKRKSAGDLPLRCVHAYCSTACLKARQAGQSVLTCAVVTRASLSQNQISHCVWSWHRRAVNEINKAVGMARSKGKAEFLHIDLCSFA